MTKTYRSTWRIEVEADSDEEARRLHSEALHAMEDAPCSVYVWGDGPEPVREQS